MTIGSKVNATDKLPSVLKVKVELQKTQRSRKQLITVQLARQAEVNGTGRCLFNLITQFIISVMLEESNLFQRKTQFLFVFFFCTRE